MNNLPEYPNTADAPYDDEISIGELLQKLWKKRGLIVFLPLVCAGLTIAGLLLTKSVGSERLSYYVELTGIKDGAYSNGVTFSPQDLLNPKVVNKLTDEFSLENPEEIGEHLRVQYGTPLSMGTLAEYNAALAANSKSTPEEVARINELYTQRLRAESRRGLSISVDYTALGLSKPEGALLLRSLPKTWNEVFASEFKIFLDTGILALSTRSNKINLSTIVGAAEADSSLNIMEKGLLQLRDDTRFRGIVFQGKTPADAVEDLILFRTLFFEPIFTLSFSEEGGLSSVYRRDLQLQLVELNSQLTELDARIEVILEVQQRPSKEGLASSGNTSGSSQIQLESNALGQLVNLSKTASLAEYLQQTLDQRLEIVSKQASINTRLAKMGSNVSGINISGANNLDANFYTAAFQRFSALQNDYAGLVQQAQVSALAETPALYQVTTEITGQKLLERRDFLFMALALALGGMVAVISALLWPAKS